MTNSKEEEVRERETVPVPRQDIFSGRNWKSEVGVSETSLLFSAVQSRL